MQSPAHAFLSVWESFYVIVGSSAAALTGLQFVVIALIADTPMPSSADSVGAFGTPTIVHFCLCLFLAALLSAPWHSLHPVQWLLLATGIAGVCYTFIVMRRARRQTLYKPVAEDWLWHAVFPLLAYGALTASAIFLPHDPATSLFVAGAVGLALIYIGIHNAWDSVSYVATQQRKKPKE